MLGEEGQGRQAEASAGKQARYTSFDALLRQRHCLPSARLGLARAPALARLCPAVSPSVGFSMPLRRPRRSSVTRPSFCFCPTRTTPRCATPRQAALIEPMLSSASARARAVVSLFLRSTRLSLSLSAIRARRCYIPLPFSPPLLFLAPASSLLLPLRSSSRDVCFTPSKSSPLLAISVARSSSGLPRFELCDQRLSPV